MADDKPLSEDERAELEQLRAEKARQAEEARARRERQELQQLRAQKARSQAEAQKDADIRAARQRGAKLMEPDPEDDDIKMPTGQKLVLLGIAVVAVVFGILLHVFRGQDLQHLLRRLQHGKPLHPGLLQFR